VVYTKVRVKKSVFGDNMNLLFHNSFSLLIGQGILLLFFSMLFIPIMTFGIEISLKVSGIRYVNINNLWRFISNPLSILTLLILFFIISQFALIEIYFLTIYFSAKKSEKKVKIFRVVMAAVFKVLSGIFKGNVRLIFTAWVTLIVANLPLIFYIMRKNRFVSILLERVSNYQMWIAASLIFITFLAILVYRKAFVFHYHLIKKSTFGESIKQAHTKKINHPNKTLLYYIGWNLCQAVILILLYVLIIAITIGIVSISVDKRIAVVAFITINEKLKGYITIFVFLVSTISHFSLFTQLFYHYKLAPETYALDEIYLSKTVKKLPYKRIVITVLIVLITANLYFFINIMRNGSVLNAISLDAIQITAHRGFSHEVPENTIPAIERAIEEKSDYIEVDVRSTKDGELILLHDSSLRRTTGLNKLIWNVTYDEIKDLDAGSWLSKDYANVKIPTLQEVFEITKGKAYLNIDLKYSSNQDEVVYLLTDLIHEYHMEWQCIVTSTSLKYLEEIKKIDPSIRTGYISLRLNPTVIKNEQIDVLSLKSNLVTQSTIEEIYKNDKQIFVWTVNTKEELERVSRLGVNNIITDNPVFAREVIYQADSDGYLATLLKIVLE